MSENNYTPEKAAYLKKVRERVDAMPEERRLELERRVNLYEKLTEFRKGCLNG